MQSVLSPSRFAGPHKAPIIAIDSMAFQGKMYISWHLDLGVWLSTTGWSRTLHYLIPKCTNTIDVIPELLSPRDSVRDASIQRPPLPLTLDLLRRVFSGALVRWLNVVYLLVIFPTTIWPGPRLQQGDVLGSCLLSPSLEICLTGFRSSRFLNEPDSSHEHH